MISDNPVQDYDSVHYAQLSVGKYLKDDLQLNITKLHKFTDGWAVQYKSRDCIGDLLSLLADFGFTIQFKETSSKHPMRKANKMLLHPMRDKEASLAVVCGTASIINAKDLCDHLTSYFSKPTQVITFFALQISPPE